MSFFGYQFLSFFNLRTDGVTPSKHSMVTDETPEHIFGILIFEKFVTELLTLQSNYNVKLKPWFLLSSPFPLAITIR